MNVEIICVGTELLLGDILNTNAKYLSQQLAEMGFNLFSQSVVGDNAERLEKQLLLSLSRSEIVILTGGLGPTNDDITKETVAKVLKLPLQGDPESLKRIEEYFARTGRKMSENNKKQANTIKSATILENDHGTAPGYFVKTKNNTVILLPGPPAELQPMFENSVIPLLKGYSSGIILSHNIRIFGIGESAVAERCGELLEKSNPTVATYAKTGEVDIRVTAHAENKCKADDLMVPIISRLNELFGNNIYGTDVDSLQQRVVDLLREQNKKLATAESCTAGMLSGRITEIPGSSEVFEMGVTAYANYIKVQALGVDPELIARRGAVCDEVAAQMAVGIRTMCNSNIGVGITGVAGPGQSEGKPAGLVYIAVADAKNVYVRKILARGSDREHTRILATSTALDMVRRYLEGCDDLLVSGSEIGAPIKLMEGYTLPTINLNVVIPQAENVGPARAPAVIYNDKELLEMFKAVDNVGPSKDNEKMEIEDDSMSFIFEDDDYILADAREVKIEYDDPTDNEQVTNNKKIGFLRSFIPWKGDPVSEIIRKSIFLIAFVVLIATTAYLINYFAEGFKQTGIVNDAATVWDTDEESMQRNESGIFISFESLISANSDIKAWMKIEGTNINNPVYQTDDNDFYVDHNMNKEPSRYGALFIDKNNIVGENETSQNTIVYGHHMRDGTMFGPLKNYTDLDFYKEHSIIDYTTLYKEGKYKIFAVFITNTLAEHDNGEVFNYRRTDFSSEQDFLSFVDEIKKRSIIDTGVDVLGTDEILTLSTCTYEFDDARLVVVARRIRKGESSYEYSSTSAAKVNPNPLYPEIWYTKKGLKKPQFDESSSVPAVTSETVLDTEVMADESSEEAALSSDGAVSPTDSSKVVSSAGSSEVSSAQSQQKISSSAEADTSAAVTSNDAASASNTAFVQSAS